jgi:predicted nucleotidyltransferase/DNA-binding transcriptional ArsR family regulator
VLYTATAVNTTATSPILEQLLGSRLRAKLLGWLLSHPGERYFVRQLASLLQEDSTNLSRELSRLEALGIVNGSREGLQKYFLANPSSPIYPELRGLVLKTSGVGDTLKQALRPLSDRITLAFLFGSVAAGKETAASDIDLLVAGDISLGEVVGILSPVQDQLGREVNPMVYPVTELRAKIERGHHFLQSVFAGPKIALWGDAREFERLAQVRVVD